jgi:hypothetical protein
MARFTQRIGLKPERSIIQVDSLDEPTRVAIWNSMLALIEHLEKEDRYPEQRVPSLMRYVWMDFLEKPTDTFSAYSAQGELRKIVLAGQWGDVLDLVEFLADAVQPTTSHQKFAKWIGGDFERYLVGYRLVDDHIIPVSDQYEVNAIEDAAKVAGAGARVHLQRAKELLSNRSTPQYAKVIAESISAVESCVFELTGVKVLSAGLKKLDESGNHTHPALVAAWEKLYGYTSDAAGIRHALIRDEDATEALSVYFLVSCSAFINLLMKEHA